MLNSELRRLVPLGATLVLLAVVLLPSPTQAQYCTSRGCCPGRDDECTTRYFDTLCYCDIFCNTTAMDCCPDFWYYCMGAPRRTRPLIEKPLIDYCISSGVVYYPGSSIKRNCNTCVCTLAPDGNADFVCDDIPCLVDSITISDVNEDYYLGWRASNYSFLWGLTQAEGVLYRLGTFPPGRALSEMAEVNIDTEGALPETFDARENWPGLIDEVIDQGKCGSSWAISTASVASDRLAIQSMGEVNPRLSEQHLLSCNIRGQRGCSGGYLDRAWYHLRRAGAVSRACYPYHSGLDEDTIMQKLRCRVPYGSSQCPERGVTSDLYLSTPPYRIAAREVDIMTEIYQNGPVQATFNVKNDFFVYNRGVYRNVKQEFTASQSDADQAGWHSVKIVGWGIDRSDWYNPIKYWLCTNSWGRNWGEQGMFRIVRGVNECEIESFVLGVWMQVGNNHM
ncbi:tubulointerstitial nephritis antigen-like [Strongylocentrotus purpuratus]|uniref:SMB domain-containing protein n=1 Tax=Strongylocentrotus purpuratus TaxID=7668 RepID=A0A7M7SXR5_STRPU|nr:tubulointerstitial nephritis antigen-like [Strongylocentrotus purpuratus]